MAWHASLALDYRLEAGRSVARHRHQGPLRVLQSLYPERENICHNVLVHPPGGLVGGDLLDIRVDVGEGAHGLVTTPGAARFYRSAGEAAAQHTQLSLAPGARFEWLPAETLCYDQCQAENRLGLQLAPGAEVIGWDITAFGLPHAGKPFTQGALRQHLELPGVWLERARIAADDALLMDSPLGMAGQRCIATLFFACGDKLTRGRREQVLDAARAVIEGHALRATAGATCPNAQVVVVRALAPVVEPAMGLLQQIWAAWRGACWQLPATPPRIWAM
ncbi:urease accessory protein UreD [Pseudorhodoferax sp. Leaf265]|jgi:urease accessory protein|uniref:urease accessory protein UreD n=1 Tax=Pseudorhodoferax sp. Leaf265 TaxID=1736315 RepID=UPI000701EAC3|nr:urease accessory protein UreD [Pseudorhodoferax sp. Leaf265]KQP19362.1 urease accessory protein ureD [Pseudorhodoferax sp. Leaf265]PZP99540.1 MAG: urease accessory protein UreD [Variovorax paradoxus]PZQ11454.1 MAG: urease accessory protein UreD [Variovorax paradoxus]